MENTGVVVDNGESELHVMMFPYFAFGHISPFLQLARKLATYSGVRITFLSAAGNVARIASLLPSLPSVAVLPLALPHVDGLPSGLDSTADATPATAELLMRANDLTKPEVQSLLAALRPHLIFHDFAQPWLADLAAPLGIKTIFFSVFAAVSTAYLTGPARRLPGGYPSLYDLRSPPEGFPSTSSIKSVPTYQAADFTYVFNSFHGMPCVYERVGKGMEGAAAILIKSCMEMEGPYVDYIRAQYQKPVLLAGPLVPEPPSGELDEQCAAWLESFAEGSVIFCSFGSETFLSDEEVRELLLGLEMTGLPFLAVLNFPGRGGEEALKKKLPEGFEERVAGKARVQTGWVQQQHILTHKSVGCYVCHAGLSSVMEGVVAGCQLVLLPQKGDQYLNTALFAGDLGLGVEVERDAESGGFTREAVCEAVRKVAVEVEEEEEEQGRMVRENHKKLREFLLDKEVLGKFMEGLVERLKELAAK